MIAGLGVDIVEIERMRAALERHPRMKERLFSAEERAYCDKRNRPEVHYALRFAAKEAVLKALGHRLRGHAVHRRRGGRARPSGRPVPASAAAGPPSARRSSASSRCTCRCRSRTRPRSPRPSRSPRTRDPRQGRAGRSRGASSRRRSRRRGRCSTRSSRGRHEPRSRLRRPRAAPARTRRTR